MADKHPWMFTRPATTIVADARMAGPGRSEYVRGGVSRQDRPGSTRLTVEDAALLQSYPTTEWSAEMMSTYSDHRSLDLFAGTGWGVAHQRLGVEEMGVEKMPEAIATREANGMTTIYEDVWDFELANRGSYDTLVASPPCQTFSMAGHGAGRRALSQVLQTIDNKWSSIYELREHSLALGDERIGLVLTPLHYALFHRPEYIVLEQVTPVLPVWERMAEVLRTKGYSAWTGVLNAEQYGVPQTRRRAILIARRDGKIAEPPKPTHSRYYTRDPLRLDVGVQKWVSMAEALGWGMIARPYPVIASGRTSGGPDREKVGGSAARKIIYGEQEADRWAGEKGPVRIDVEEASVLQTYPTLRSNQSVGGVGRAEREGDQPSVTVTGLARSMQIIEGEEVRNMTVDEAGTLQTYPTHFTQNNKLEHQAVRPLEHQAVRPLEHPAPTITAGHDSGNRGFITGERFDIATPEQVASMQSFPAMKWVGAKTKTFLQIGNAVPPLLAQRILEETWSR